MNAFKVLTMATCCALLVSGNVMATGSKLLPVPAAGVASLNEAGLNHFQQMGPLEYTGHALPLPDYPAWRLRFTLHPQMENNVLSGYQVKADRINLSSLIYQELVDSYGKGNADPVLNNHAPGDSHTLPFTIVQNLAADLVTEEISKPITPQTHIACGLQLNCGQTWSDSEGDWGQPDIIKLKKSPWPGTSDVSAMLRALAKKAGWLQKHNANYQWITPEQPEGIGSERPWVDVTVDNHPGNGGVLLADWVEIITDDSTSARVIRLIHEPTPPTQTMVFSAYLCSRGNSTNKVAQQCP